MLTRLSKEMRSYWLDELIGITRSGGLIIITVHGKSRTSVFTEEQQEIFRLLEDLVPAGGGFLVA